MFLDHPDVVEQSRSLFLICGKCGWFLHCMSRHTSVLSLPKIKCAPDKSTGNYGVGRRRLVAFPVGREGGEF